MSPANIVELHRLCDELKSLFEREDLSPATQEALQKASLALSLVFIHGLCGKMEEMFAGLDQPMTSAQLDRLQGLGARF